MVLYQNAARFAGLALFALPLTLRPSPFPATIVAHRLTVCRPYCRSLPLFPPPASARPTPRQLVPVACLACASSGPHPAKPRKWPLAGHNCSGPAAHPTGGGSGLALSRAKPLRPSPAHPFRPHGGHRAPSGGPYLAKQPLPSFPLLTPPRRVTRTMNVESILGLGAPGSIFYLGLGLAGAPGSVSYLGLGVSDSGLDRSSTLMNILAEDASIREMFSAAFLPASYFCGVSAP